MSPCPRRAAAIAATASGSAVAMATMIKPVSKGLMPQAVPTIGACCTSHIAPKYSNTAPMTKRSTFSARSSPVVR